MKLHSLCNVGIETLQVNDLVSWVETHGWKKIAHPNENFFVFVDPQPDGDPPLTITIPRHTKFGDTYQRFAETIQVLAQYYDCPPQALVQEINQQHRYRLRHLPSNAAKATKRPTAKARRNKSQSSRNPKP